MLTQDTDGAPHVLRAAVDGTTTDIPVTGLPAGAQINAYVTSGSVRRIAVVHTLDGTRSVGLVDLADGAFRSYVSGVRADSEAVFNDRRLVADWKAVRVDAEPGTQPSAVAGLPGHLQAVVGGQVLAGNPDFVQGGTHPALSARSLVTGAASTVLSPSFGGIGPTLDGGALATAGPTGLDWNVHRITPTQDGGVATEKVAQIQPYAVGVQGLALAGGELFLYGATPGAANRFSSFQLDATGRPTGQQTPAARRSLTPPASPATPPAPSWRPWATAGSPTCGPAPRARDPSSASASTPRPAATSPWATPAAASPAAAAAMCSTTAAQAPRRSSTSRTAPPAARPPSAAPVPPPPSGAR
ncbi:hypothetical protein ACQEV2_30210 [Streptomyces sp. CA-251387]|uniref:hypothetical protein n=1 Tax=Streptomyces sp. CA-251387 TaxID=3240064 RepID=UPI003D91216C